MSEEIKNCVCSVKKASKDNNIMLARKLTVLEGEKDNNCREVSEREER